MMNRTKKLRQCCLLNQQSNKRNKKCHNCGPTDHLRNECPFLRRENKKEGSTEGRFGGYCSYCGKRGHSKDQCWIKHPELRNKKEEKQDTVVETEIIVTTFEVIKQKEEMFEVDAKKTHANGVSGGLNCRRKFSENQVSKQCK